MSHTNKETTNRLYIYNSTMTYQRNTIKAQKLILSKSTDIEQIYPLYQSLQYWNSCKESNFVSDCLKSLEEEERDNYAQAVTDHAEAYSQFFEHYKELINQEEENSPVPTTSL